MKQLTFESDGATWRAYWGDELVGEVDIEGRMSRDKPPRSLVSVARQYLLETGRMRPRKRLKKVM